MKHQVLSFIFLILGCSTFNAQYNASGDAVQTSCDCYTLTPDEIGQVGSVWNVNLIDLSDSFFFSFDIFLGCNNGSGADGMAFGLQPLGTGIGNAGNGMGMSGVDPSLGVFFDTFQNATDPIEDHIAINSNGFVLHDDGVNDLAGPIPLGNIEDCDWHEFQVEWNSVTQTLSAYFDGFVAITYTGDIVNDIFDGNPEVYWGFTSSTGGATNEHKVCTQVNSEIAVDFPILCAGQEVSFFDNSTSTNGVVGWDWDFGDGNSSTDQNPMHIYEDLGDFDIELTITDVSGCESISTIPVEVVGPYSGEDGSAEVCPQDTEFVLLEQMPGADSDGYWLDSAGLPVENIYNALESEEGVYTYVVESDLCPTVTSTLELVYISICDDACTMDPFQTEVVDNICFGALEGELSIDAVQGLEYSIDNGVTFQADPNFVGLSSGIYEVAVQYDGCVKFKTVEIISPSQVILTASEDETICIDGETTITADAIGGVGGYTYYWDNALGEGQDQSIQPDEDNCFSVYAIDGNGCESESDEICISLFLPLEVDISEDLVLCPGNSIDISASASGGSGVGYQYLWYANGSSFEDGPTAEVAPMQNEEYCIVVVDNCTTPSAENCMDIEVPWLYPQFIAEQEIGCAPQSIEFYNLTDPDEIISSEWTFSDGGTDDGLLSAEHIFNSAGCFDVSLVVTSNIGCEYLEEQDGLICIDDYPIADYFFGPQPTSVSNPNISFTNNSSGATTYEWFFPAGCDIEFTTEEDPKVRFPDGGPGDYPVQLIAISNLGCTDSITQFVEIQGELVVYVPNTFTPDFDGVNDVFYPVVLLPEEIVFFDFRIFNRWGKEVFASQSLDEYWTGESIGETHFVDDDVYLWRIELQLKDQAEIKLLTGYVTVIR